MAATFPCRLLACRRSRATYRSKEIPHRGSQTSFSGVGRDLICGSEGGSPVALAGTVRTVIVARCPDGGSSPTARWWAGLCGGQRSPEVVARRADLLGWVVSCWRGAAVAEAAGRQRPYRGIASGV